MNADVNLLIIQILTDPILLIFIVRVFFASLSQQLNDKILILRFRHRCRLEKKTRKGKSNERQHDWGKCWRISKMVKMCISTREFMMVDGRKR